MMSRNALIVFVLVAACGVHLTQGARHGKSTLRRTALDLRQPQAPARVSTLMPAQPPKTTESPVSEIANAAVPDLPSEVDDVVREKVEQNTERFHRKISGFDLYKELVWTLGAATKTFLPQFRLEFIAFVKALCTVLLGMTWFGIYVGFIYINDRSEKLDPWKAAMERDAHEHVSPRSTYTPDYMLVFHHPGFKHHDNDEGIYAAELDRVLTNTEECVFTELDKLKESAVDGSTGLFRASMRGLASQATGSEKPVDEKVKVEMLEARQAFLKDMYRNLPLWGFDVTVFSSIDGDELFVCVSLNRKESIDYYLKKNNTQVQLRQEIIPRLGIRQDPDDPASSPPSISYDYGMVERLHDIGILISKEETELFKSFPNSGKVTVVNTKDCIWTIHNEIAQHVDLCAAKEEGLLVTWYPVHNPNQIALFRSIWANWSCLFDLTFRQPIPLIRDYFGPRIGFLFEWNGVYCKGLLVLVTVAMAQVIIVRVCRDLLGINLLRSRQVLGFSIVLVVWSKMMQNLYLREQNFFLELWNIRPHGGHSHSMRPQFKGEPAPSPVDANVKELQFPMGRHLWRIVVTAVATVGFCILVASCIFMWLLVFDGKMGILSSIMLSAQIKVFEFTFTVLATKFTEYENHKYEADYHNSLLWKLFLFNFVNNYCAFFFMTVRNAWLGCLDDCLHTLRKQVAMCLCILGACTVAQLMASQLIVKFTLWWELRQLKKSGQEVPARFVLEEQAKYTEIDGGLELQNMMTLVISLGHVILFGGVSAAVVPYCFVVFTVQLRAFAVLLTTCSQRPFPHTSLGVGHWQYCITFLTCLGVLYAGFLFVAYGEAFRGSTVRAKMTGVLLFCLFSFTLWSVIDLVFPAEDKARSLMCERRAHVARKLVSRVGAKGLASMREATLRQMTVCNADLIEDGQWDRITALANMPKGPKTPLRKHSEHFTEEQAAAFAMGQSEPVEKKAKFSRRASSAF